MTNINQELHTKGQKVCLIADLHVGVHQNSIFWHETSLKWAEWLRDQLLEKEITDIFILGDVYHYRDEVAVNTIHVVNQILSLWKDFNIVILVGNHDAYYKDRADINSLSILNGKNNITVIDQTSTFTVFGKTLTFLPWGAKLADLPKSDIAFGHLEIESFKMNSFKLCEHGTKTSDILRQAKLVFTGHFHLRDEREYDNGTIVYVGNPFEMDFGDTGTTKGYYILDIPTSEYCFYENTISPKHKKLTLTDISETKNIKDAIGNNIVKIVVDKKVDTDKIESLIKKMSSLNPFSLSVDYSLYDDNISVDDQNYEAGGVDLQKTIEEFINVLDIDNKAEVIQYCMDLYKRSHTL